MEKIIETKKDLLDALTQSCGYKQMKPYNDGKKEIVQEYKQRIGDLLKHLRNDCQLSANLKMVLSKLFGKEDEKPCSIQEFIDQVNADNISKEKVAAKMITLLCAVELFVQEPADLAKETKKTRKSIHPLC